MPEPRWIAYELHDGLMQWVIGARMHMAALVAAIKEGRAPEDLPENLSQVLAYLNQATEDGRQLIRFIEGLDDGETVDASGVLATTCEILTRKTRDGKPELEFVNADPAWPQLETEKAWPIVRIVQQAVFNAIAHSGGDHVAIRLGWRDDNLLVEVVDNGRGFDPNTKYPGHFGLRTMRQRALESGMQLDIQSSHLGTRVSLVTQPEDKLTTTAEQN